MDGAADAILLLKVDLRDLVLGEHDLSLNVSLGGRIDDVLNGKALDCLILSCIKSVRTNVSTAVSTDDGLNVTSAGESSTCVSALLCHLW